MLAWNEADHPRGADGRFIAKGGGMLAVAVVAVILLFGSGFLKTTGKEAATTSFPATWKTGGMEFTTLNSDTAAACDAYGAVKTYLAAHPCSGVRRGLFEVGEPGKKIAVATATVTMPSAEQAGQLRELADRPGTGNITELSTGFDGRHYASAVSGNVVTIAQAKAQMLADPSSSALDGAAQAALGVPAG
ncbi:hypothetical protein L3Q65_00065 (plasmid) [Amycolatopsis sp. FU40]|uniref:hypothetical protein n=1 Tax=Amycolatopsis sp. FU40 TaxID=2914159 RepID=UPI001F224497|nr:hypothetical protein [Amycolatopsis sp. FU40]UKD50754.1 hypothetical protein L3Q65_00065 [Amycolatopsis sp. FU40]